MGEYLLAWKVAQMKEQSISDRFRTVIAQVRQEGYKVNHCLVNSVGELKILSEITFMASNIGTSHLGHYFGIPVFSAYQQKDSIVFVIESPEGFFTVTGDKIEPYKHSGPIFIMEIKP